LRSALIKGKKVKRDSKSLPFKISKPGFIFEKSWANHDEILEKVQGEYSQGFYEKPPTKGWMKENDK
jgi:hypothetical protein